MEKYEHTIFPDVCISTIQDQLIKFKLYFSKFQKPSVTWMRLSIHRKVLKPILGTSPVTHTYFAKRHRVWFRISFSKFHTTSQITTPANLLFNSKTGKT